MSSQSTTPCRALVGSFGRPGMRDLDFGRQVVECLQQLEWPDEVVVEDLSCSAPLVLHRLQELRPAKVVLVGAVARDFDPPGTIRRYQVDLTPAEPEEVRRSVEESAMGLVDLDHTLAMARHWGGLPADTVVIEVEPAEASFGLGFSEELADSLDPILDMVRKELAGAGRHPDFDPSAAVMGPSGDLDDLLAYARDHANARLQADRAPALVDTLASPVPGVSVAGQVRPWGVFTKSGGDWFDAVPLTGGSLGIVVGDVAGRGVEVASVMGDLRAAARAYAVLEGDSPARLVGHLDRLAETTGLGRDARLLYLVVQPTTGEVRYTNAGGCPALLLDGVQSRFLEGTAGPPLGAGAVRREGTFTLDAGTTALLFTDGLVESRAVPRRVGMQRLLLTATEAPQGLEDLCRHVLGTCSGRLRRDDDICLVGLRLVPESAPAVPAPSRHG